MAAPKSKADKFAGFLEDLTVEDLDQHLLKLSREWMLVYANRQILARQEGNTTRPPAPPKVDVDVKAGHQADEDVEPSSADETSPLDSAGTAFNGTVGSLIDCYLTDEGSPFHALRHGTRQNYKGLLRRLKESCGSLVVADLESSEIQKIHEGWAAGNKGAIAHSLITMLRSLSVFGATALGDDRCRGLSFILHRMKFKQPKSRNEQITAEQARLIVEKANKVRLHSLALAQAFQFDCKLKQRDAIGEWVPLSEPGQSDVTHDDMKWHRGIRWEEIDNNFTLTHVTSKKQQEVVLDLRLAPMVMDELRYTASVPAGASLTRDMLPISGPVIVSEITDQPWTANEFRRQWRKIARACGISDNVYNMDTSASLANQAAGDPAPANAGLHSGDRVLN
jgi:hypothetical protein